MVDEDNSKWRNLYIFQIPEHLEVNVKDLLNLIVNFPPCPFGVPAMGTT